MRRALPRLGFHLRQLAVASESLSWSHKVDRGAQLANSSFVSPWIFPASLQSSRPVSARSAGDNGEDKKTNKASQRGLGKKEQEIRLRQHQIRRPWHRANADQPPVNAAGGGEGRMTKGNDTARYCLSLLPNFFFLPFTCLPLSLELTRPSSLGKLLTTPTRLLKLLLPLPLSVEKDSSNNARDYGRAISTNEKIQPLALLVHPQQPLSYVERLIQAELPPVVEDGKEKIPSVYFRAEDAEGSENKPTTRSEARTRDQKNQEPGGGGGSPVKPAHVAAYSGLGREGPERSRGETHWVRWSSSTEVGDFIRDAARGREFAIEVEGYGIEIHVSVPSFSDRTHYMRLRLRRMSRRIDDMTTIKRECDLLAHRGANRLAKGGFALLSAWWGVVYYVTFHTEFGWDLVEPVTYLAGLTTIMGGYLWFLYISRDLSYKAAMNITVSRRQNALYESRGFDLQRWEHMVQEANAVRNEIKKVALEYDVDWDDTQDVGEEVKEVLDSEKRKAQKPEPDEDEETAAAEAEDEEATEKEKSKTGA